MKIAGTHCLALDRQQAYELLQDPEILAKCMPGCRHLAAIGPDEYEMQMNVVISAVQGLFAGKIRVTDQNPYESYRLIVEGTGKVGFMKGDGLLRLAPREGATEVQYEGDVQVGGMIAGVGQRLLDSSAKFVIRKFFARLEEQLQLRAAPSPEAPPEVSGPEPA